MKNTLKNKLAALAVSSAALIGTASAQTDAGTLVKAEIDTVAGYAATIIPAGLIVWGFIWGVRKVKSMGRAAS